MQDSGGPTLDRETFLAWLYNGPLLPSDALVVLSGDGTVRIDAALGALRQGAAHYVVASGGVDNPPHALTAHATRRYLIDNGLHPDRIIEEPDSQNTHDQAGALVRLCAEHKWARVLLVTSPYHMPRAFLTVLAELRRAGAAEKVHVLPLPAAQVRWTDKPDGLDVTRLDLFADELRKIDEYSARGHVASYAEGLAYMRYWERGPE